MRPPNPYNKGPLQKYEIPKMVIGAGILVGGIYAMARFLTKKTIAAAHVAPEDRQIASSSSSVRGDYGRWR